MVLAVHREAQPPEPALWVARSNPRDLQLEGQERVVAHPSSPELFVQREGGRTRCSGIKRDQVGPVVLRLRTRAHGEATDLNLYQHPLVRLPPELTYQNALLPRSQKSFSGFVAVWTSGHRTPSGSSYRQEDYRSYRLKAAEMVG